MTPSEKINEIITRRARAAVQSRVNVAFQKISNDYDIKDWFDTIPLAEKGQTAKWILYSSYQEALINFLLPKEIEEQTRIFFEKVENLQKDVEQLMEISNG